VPAIALAAVPRGFTPVQATAIWQQYLTAYGPLVLYTKLKAGSVVLVTAATSSVGHACIQVAKAQGATVIATTRQADKVERLKATGADHVIVTNQQDIVLTVMTLTDGKGANVIVDSISGPIVNELVDCAAQKAQLFLYGRLDETPTPFPLITCMKKGLSITGYTLWEIVLDAQIRREAERWIINRLESGSFAPVIDRIFTLDQIAQAHTYMDANQANGKIVVAVV
jgi:NADPH:quinone reductase